MTEDEAKTKWCPVAGLAGAFFFSEKDEPYDIGNRGCIGSACMMWRSRDASALDGESKGTHGFCGLAGADVGVIQIPAPLLRDEASEFTASELNALKDKRRMGPGVYSNPQPGDADFPAGQKMDIGSGG